MRPSRISAITETEKFVNSLPDRSQSIQSSSAYRFAYNKTRADRPNTHIDRPKQVKRVQPAAGNCLVFNSKVTSVFKVLIWFLFFTWFPVWSSMQRNQAQGQFDFHETERREVPRQSRVRHAQLQSGSRDCQWRRVPPSQIISALLWLHVPRINQRWMTNLFQVTTLVLHFLLLVLFITDPLILLVQQSYCIWQVQEHCSLRQSNNNFPTPHCQVLQCSINWLCWREVVDFVQSCVEKLAQWLVLCYDRFSCCLVPQICKNVSEVGGVIWVQHSKSTEVLQNVYYLNCLYGQMIMCGGFTSVK